MILGQSMGVVSSRVGQANAPIQQIKSAGLTARGASTQGLPQAVNNLSVSVAKSGAMRTMRVSFIQNPSDPYFSTAHVYVQQGTAQPTLVASGISPVSVSLPQTNAPAKVTVVSSGNWGATPLASSPGKAVSLA